MTDILTIYIHHGDNKIDKININPRDTIQSIENHINLPKHRFVFLNNCILFGSFTFSFYKVTNGDHLFVIPMAFSIAKTIHEKLTEFPILSKFLHSNNNQNNINNSNNSSEKRISTFLRETAKLKDQFFQKVEGTVLNHRKTLERLANIIKPKNNNDQVSHVTVIPPPCINPSTETLPKLWKKINIEEEEKEEEEIIVSEID